ncbi:MAG TPA: hypothetical protein VGC30_02970 [Dokdonella sp.]
MTRAALPLDASGVSKDAFFGADARLRERCKGRGLDGKDARTVTSHRDYVFTKLGDLHE